MFKRSLRYAREVVGSIQGVVKEVIFKKRSLRMYFKRLSERFLESGRAQGVIFCPQRVIDYKNMKFSQTLIKSRACF